MVKIYAYYYIAAEMMRENVWGVNTAMFGRAPEVTDKCFGENNAEALQ